MAQAKHVARKSKAKKTENADFTLNDVLQLGGNKADFDLLKDIDENVDALDVKEDLDADPVKKDELQAFIKELGFGKLKDKMVEEEDEGGDTPTKKEKKKKGEKLVSSLVEERESVDKKGKSKRNKYKIQHEEVSSTGTPYQVWLHNPLANYEARKHLLIKPVGKWIDQLFSGDPQSFEHASEEVIKRLEQFAARLLQDDVDNYRQQQDSQKKSEAGWIKTVLSSGTLSDKRAALTLLIQDAPVHNLAALDTLIGMVKKKGNRESILALESLQELFLSELLPEERKLKTFEQHPFTKLDELTSGNQDTRDRRLIMWYYEAQLKEKYAAFIRAVEAISHDTIPAIKKKALATTYELLAGRPEEEKTLLAMLVNKLGDPDHKIASNGAHLLGKLVQRHPNMKFVISLEVERLLYRPNMPAKAQYYAVCFLNQLVLSHEEKELAARLIGVYFSFFKSFVKKGEVESKMLSALLTGVNRAYPYAKVDQERINEHMNHIYKVVHIVNFNTSVQALMLLYQVMDSSDTVSDRYYTALYKKMLDPGLKHSSKQTMFLNLLFKSMKKDVAEKRVKAFVKRLLQVCCHHAPTFVCGALVLLSEVLKARPGLLNLTHTPEDSDDDDEEEHFQDVPDDDEDGDIEGTEKMSEVETVLSTKGHTTVSSWVHRTNLGGRVQSSSGYDPHHRNPLYCGAEQESVWELRRLAQFYHPSVALFAQTLLKGQTISYPGDPLEDFTLIRFLDRFVYRNPKKKEQSESAKTPMRSRHKDYVPTGARGLAVNSEDYLQKGENNIPIDERFFYRYFSQQAAKVKKVEVEDFDSDAESVSDTEFDDFLDSYENQFDADGDVNFDFASDFGKQKTKRKGSAEDSDEDDDDDEVDDLSEEEPDFGDDEDFKAEFADADDFEEEDEESGQDGGNVEFDEEAVAFSDEDEFADIDFSAGSQGKRSKRGMDDMFAGSTSKKRRMDKDDTSGLFAAAEEFSNLIDENTGSKVNMTGSEALSNKDNASVKQLKWEQDRNHWMQDKDWRGKRFKKQGKGGARKHRPRHHNKPHKKMGRKR